MASLRSPYQWFVCEVCKRLTHTTSTYSDYYQNGDLRAKWTSAYGHIWDNKEEIEEVFPGVQVKQAFGPERQGTSYNGVNVRVPQTPPDSNEDGFLRAIQTKPDDPLLYQVYCDYLLEHAGEARVQAVMDQMRYMTEPQQTVVERAEERKAITRQQYLDALDVVVGYSIVHQMGKGDYQRWKKRGHFPMQLIQHDVDIAFQFRTTRIAYPNDAKAKKGAQQ